MVTLGWRSVVHSLVKLDCLPSRVVICLYLGLTRARSGRIAYGRYHVIVYMQRSMTYVAYKRLLQFGALDLFSAC